jgi:outer membrane receptor for ferrienterochelin and colicin
MKLILLIIFIFCVISSGFGKNTNKMSLEELMNTKVITASKEEISMEKAPAMISVFTGQEIELSGAKTFWEVLKLLPGVVVIDNEQNNFIGFRGDKYDHQATHVLMLINSIPINMEGYNGGFFNQVIYKTLPVESIERIEILKGPGSVLYGSNAFVGVINVITKKEKDRTFANASFGSLNTKRMAFGVSKNYEDFSFNFFANYLNTDGWNLKALSSDSLQINDNVYEKDNVGILADVSYKFLTASVNYYKVNNYGWNGEKKSHVGQTSPSKLSINLKGEYELMNDLVLTSYFSQNFSSHDLFLAGRFPVDTTLNYNFNDKIFDANIIYSALDQFTFLFGTTVNNFIGTSFTVPEEWNYSWLSLYSLVTWSPFDYLDIFAGTQNYRTGYTNKTVPKFGFIFNGDEFGLKTNVSQAFRSPFVSETDFDFGELIGNQNLKPEIVTSYETQIFWQNESLFFSVTGYYNVFDDKIYEANLEKKHDDDGHERSMKNAEKYVNQGIEFESKMEFFENFIFDLSMAYNFYDDNDLILYKTNSPDLIAKSILTYTSKIFDSSIIFLYLSKFHDAKDFNPDVPILNPPTEESLIINLNTKMDVGKVISRFDGIELELQIKNLLDSQIYIPELYNKINTKPSVAGRRFLATIHFNL